MTNEQTRQLVAGLNQERRGYETRLRAAEDAGDTERVEALKHRIAQVDRQLKAVAPTNKKKAKEPSGPDTAPAEEGTFDPADHTVDEVMAYVADKPSAVAQALIAAESAGKNRVTLLEGLEPYALSAAAE